MQVEAPVRDRVWDEVIEAPVLPELDPEVQRQKANEMARLIDVHLDYERQSRIPLSMDELTPRRLCPEQRTDLVTDLYAVTR
ncbi:MAG: hypothetical protein HY321_21475 [Armatimonadetes bacterium]|nr:hypothetical protein [Armatimonadota bacterium]